MQKYHRESRRTWHCCLSPKRNINISPIQNCYLLTKRNKNISPYTKLLPADQKEHSHLQSNSLFLFALSLSRRPKSSKMINSWSSEVTIDTKSKTEKDLMFWQKSTAVKNLRDWQLNFLNEWTLAWQEGHKTMTRKYLACIKNQVQKGTVTKNLH